MWTVDNTATNAVSDHAMWEPIILAVTKDIENTNLPAAHLSAALWESLHQM